MSSNGCRSLTLSRMISALVVVVLSCTAAELHAQRTTTASQFVLRVSAANAEEVAARNGLTIIRQIDGQDLFLVTKTSSPLSVSALTVDGSVSSTSTSDPEILSIEPNAVVATPESQSPDLNGSVVSILDGAGTLVDYFNNQVWK